MNFLLYQQKLNRQQILCLILAIVGITFFIDASASSLTGIVLAVLSGVFFAYYMVGMDHSSIRYISPYVFNFYLVLMNSIVIFLLAAIMGRLSVMSAGGYLLSAIVAVLTSLIGVILLQKGIYCLGASLTAILSTLEPITSLIFGVIWLGESFNSL